MALLTQAVSAETSFPQVAQQYAASIERQRAKQELKDERQKVERERAAREQGVVTAGVQGLQAYPALYSVAQRLYDDYNAADEAGNIEEAEQIKAQLMKFTDAAAAFSRSELDNFNSITTDPKKLAQYDNSIQEISSVFEGRKMSQYEVKREGNSYTLVDAQGNSYGLFDTPEMRGESFIGDLDQRATIPNYLNAQSFGERNAGRILGRTDVTDKNGKLVNAEQAKALLREDFEYSMTRTGGEFLDGVIYDYEHASGNMDKYDPDAIARLKQDPNYVKKVTDEYLASSYETVVANAREQEKVREKSASQQTRESRLRAIQNVPVEGGEALFTTRGETLSFVRTGGDQMFVQKIKPASNNLDVIVTYTVGVDRNGDPTSDPDLIVGYTEDTETITQGSEDYRRLAATQGGESYFVSLMRRANNDFAR